MTFLDLVYLTLEKHQSPLSIEEIWKKAGEYGFRDKLSSIGKTPVKTIAARVYLDIRDNPQSRLYQYSKRPATFYIKDLSIVPKKTSEVTNDELSFKERDLHPLLASFVYADGHFNCVTKTIFHEKSKKKKRGENEWLHPDMVGVYFPFNDYSQQTTNLLEALNDSKFKLFSFELKKTICFSNLREYFFQAVSNSSWANEGYLVALSYEDDTELYEEMLRLNNAFGIGFIKLNAENIEQSEILFSAREREKIDWDTVDRLVETNTDFETFVKDAVSDIKGMQMHLSQYDEVMTEPKLLKYIEEHNIKNNNN
ncbi:MAG: HrgA protein [Clostridia bacterium]|nr:HrgA protein [Clostridia bacterium]